MIYCLNEFSIIDKLIVDSLEHLLVQVTAHNTAGSSIAEYPFATLTSQGHHIPPPISGTIDRREKYAIGINSHNDGSPSMTNPNPIATVVKVVSTVFLSACLIVGAFYFAIFYRKWKLKRDLDGLSNTNGGSRSGSMQFVNHFTRSVDLNIHYSEWLYIKMG